MMQLFQILGIKLEYIYKYNSIRRKQKFKKTQGGQQDLLVLKYLVHF